MSSLMKNIKLALHFLCLILRLSNGQYTSFNDKNVMKTNSCENTSLVEQFFNIVFTEFTNTPPTCVCVQMCPDYPTYCYPNGCFKKYDSSKNTIDKQSPPISKIQTYDTTKSLMFLIDDSRDLVSDILEEVPNSGAHITKLEKLQLDEFMYRPNSFKELVLKYRKLPKLEMRYNLREQVKNSKSDRIKPDNIDVSKTRWPLNKHLLHNKYNFNSFRRNDKSDNAKKTNYFVSMFPEPANYPPKHFKKYLTKRENKGVNVESVYLYNTDVANFSLDSLIDSIVLNGVENKFENNSNDFKTSLIYNYTSGEATADTTGNVEKNNDSSLQKIEISADKESKPNSTKNKENKPNSTPLMSLDRSKYLNDSLHKDAKNESLLQMIREISKQIDNQNKVNAELMERVNANNFVEVKKISEDVVTDNPISTTYEINETIAYSTITSSTEIPKIIVGHISANTNKQKSTIPMKRNLLKNKSTPMLIRKLQRRKLN